MPLGYAALGRVSWVYAVASGRRRDGSQGGGGAHSGAMGDDDNAARRPSGGRAAGWRSMSHGLNVVIAVAGLFVALGGFVQSGVGLGLGLVAAPVVTLLDPALMPGSMLVAGASLPVLILAREALHADWPGVSWALTGRVAGTLGGIWVLAVVSLRALGIVVGGMVLAVVVLSVRSAAVPRNRATLLTAGVISGVTGTATSIGGPPVALLYQTESGPRVRATLSVFFTVGNTVAL